MKKSRNKKQKYREDIFIQKKGISHKNSSSEFFYLISFKAFKSMFKHKFLNMKSKRNEVPLFFRSSIDNHLVFLDVSAIIANQLNIDPEKVTHNVKINELGADSLDIIEIMMTLESKFDIQIDENDATEIITVADATELISKSLET
eukprot:gnl/TRDRNA2_/TRDRNA2_176836_c0_seq10.p1 gnl/TRDRNA2_/TRDRNA2_176836_c0~~gnl/TRDRNA2_/TRDRNA2_176836_c0_seq10.p1  ORF type:complete len:146 (-),score=1.96 gnl/TRDRNA2_/TRDRNA2_176836_c0_seq10:904-1341(-)